GSSPDYLYCAVERRSARLWSLWDMLKFNASEFYRVSSVLRAAEALIEHMGKSDTNFDKIPISLNNRKTLLKHMKVLSAALTVLGAKVTLVILHELVSSLKKKPKYKNVVTDLAHLRSTLRGELSLLNVLVLEEGKSQYFDPKEPLFGKEFESKFSSAAFEIDE